MGDISKNLSRHEIACNCGCGFDSFDYETRDVFQSCCDFFALMLGVDKVIADISSGCRCFAWNDHEGGSDDSKHLDARAIDFSIRNVNPKYVYDYLDQLYPDKYGLGKYESFTHLDTATGKARRW